MDERDPVLSICIVNYNAHDYLEACLKSIFAARCKYAFEIVIVDNASRDGSVEMVQTRFPQLRLIRNESNAGFSSANNAALRIAGGKYLLWLNNDTVVLPGALDTLVDFLAQHPEVGIVSPKVLNSDGTLQLQCRRGLPTLWGAFCYVSGLSRLFAKNPFFTGYLLTHLDEDRPASVDAVSGACLMARREILDQIGYPDEGYFMFAEDLDWCCLARRAGWQVFYLPEARIIHFGGRGGTLSRPFRATVEFHQSVWRFYSKHLAWRYPFIVNWLVRLAVGMKLAVALGLNLFRKVPVAGSRKPTGESGFPTIPPPRPR
jgi:GT2 family glycosyltransferase